jgi:hypothetical protein
MQNKWREPRKVMRPAFVRRASMFDQRHGRMQLRERERIPLADDTVKGK